VPNNSPWEDTSTAAQFSFLRTCTGWTSSHPSAWVYSWFTQGLGLAPREVQSRSYFLQNSKLFQKNHTFCITLLPLGQILSTSSSGLCVLSLFYSKSCSIKTLESVRRTSGTKSNVSVIKIFTDLPSKILSVYSWSLKQPTTPEMLNGECKISLLVHSSSNLNQDWFIYCEAHIVDDSLLKTG